MAEAAGWSDLTGTKRKDKPWLDGLPRLIFVSDMSDALSAAVPFEFLEEQVVRTVTSPRGQRHRWLWLTKRPERMAEFAGALAAKGVGWPPNLWAGTSITTQATTSRIKHLLRVGDGSTVRFLSVEPQLGPVDLSRWLPDLGWVIQGGESGRGARPFQLAWATAMARRCREAGVPYFLKQLGSAVFSGDMGLVFDDGHAGDWAEWPDEVRVRQMPLPDTSNVGSEAIPAPASAPVPIGSRVSLNVITQPSKGREAAIKAWATRRRNEQRSRLK
jgi:protein gp37